jgi:protocatechuate 3,4-dioxygenase beta subunit
VPRSARCVRAPAARPWTSCPPSVDSATTDTRGEFKLTKLPPGRYDFELSGPQHALRIERGVHVSPDTVDRPLRFVVTRGYELAGRVVKPSGGSVQGLRIVAFEEPRGEEGLFKLDKSFATTDESGEFVLKGLSAGRMVVVVVPEGQPFAIQDEVAVPGTDFVEIVLTGDCFLEGRITNDDEEPIPEAEVYVVGFDRGNPSVGNAVADGDGRYRIDGLQSGPVQIFIVQAAGYGSYPDDLFKMMRGGRSSDLTLAPGANERNVTLSLGGTVTGVVLEQGTDEPIEGARVSVLSASAFFGGSKGATTDATGTFVITGLPKGPAILMAEKDGYFQPGVNTQSIGMMIMGAMQRSTPQPDPGRGVQISVTDPGQTLERELKLAKGSTLRGKVVTPEGEPVAGAEVSLEAANSGGMFGGIAALLGSAEPRLTGNDGTFEMPGPAPGTRAAIVARSQGWLEGRSEELSAAPGDVVEDLVVSLRQGATVEGVIRDARGKAVPGALVRWTSDEEGRNEWEVRWALRRADAASSAEDGRFRVSGVEPGPIVVQVTHPEFPSVSRSGLKAEDGKAVTLDLDLPAGGSIQGSVKLPNGRPAVGARINLGREGGWQTDADAYGRDPGDVIVDSEGKFEVQGLPGGSYSMTASADGFADSPAVTAQPGGTAVALQLAPAFVISGTVRLEDGSPASGVRVTAQTVAEEGDQRNVRDVESTETNAAGDFILRDIPAGTYQLRIGQNWWSGNDVGVVPRTIENVQAGQEGVQIEVSSGLSITGKVFLADGSPAQEGWVSCNRIPQEGELNQENINRNGPILEGTFALKGLIPGTYRVNVNTNDGGSRSIEAEAGATDVVVRFTEGAKVSGRVIGPDGTGLAGANVWAQGEAGTGNATTDENGAYTIQGLAPGTYTIASWAQTDGKTLQGRSEEMTVADGDDRNGVDITVSGVE